MRGPLVERVFHELQRQAGLVFNEGRRASATSTIEHWLTGHQVGSVEQIGPGAALNALLETLVVHESYFDRDLDQLRLIEETMLTSIERKHDSIRVWSAGCAAGEEAYTLAFMLARRGLLRRTKLIATDLSHAALVRARGGRYRGWSVRTGADTPALRYLVRSGAEWCVPEPIRRAVSFGRLNLVTDPFPEDQHLIVCRNVLIYLDSAAIEAVATKLVASLAPDGWLIVAPSDPRLDSYAALDVTVSSRGLHYRRSDRPRSDVGPAVVQRPFVALTAPRAPRWSPPNPPVAPGPATLPVVTTGESLRDLARQLADRGDIGGARTILDRALIETPLDAELHFLAAVIAAEEDPRACLALLERATYLTPDAAVAYLFAGRIHQALEQKDAARRSYGRALRVLDASDPDSRVAWCDETAGMLATACRATLEGLR